MLTHCLAAGHQGSSLGSSSLESSSVRGTNHELSFADMVEVAQQAQQGQAQSTVPAGAGPPWGALAGIHEEADEEHVTHRGPAKDGASSTAAASRAPEPGVAAGPASVGSAFGTQAAQAHVSGQFGNHYPQYNQYHQHVQQYTEAGPQQQQQQSQQGEGLKEAGRLPSDQLGRPLTPTERSRLSFGSGSHAIAGTGSAGVVPAHNGLVQAGSDAHHGNEVEHHTASKLQILGDLPKWKQLVGVNSTMPCDCE